MAGEWKRRPLGELVENFDSIRVPVKENERVKGTYPYYGASGIVDYVDKYLFDGEYLLIAEDGENLRTRNTPIAFMATGQFWVNNHAHIVRGNGEADTRYLMYALAATDISGYLTGSTMPKLTQGNMNRVPLIAPPFPDQQAIACILGALDDKIELNRQMNQTLEAMARAIFKSWFVDFDPVRAKATGKKPAGLKPDLAALFPDSFENSELGEIPEGWKTGSILRQADLLSGGTPKTDVPAYWGGEIPWASAKDVSQCGEAFLIDSERTITKLGVQESSTKIIPAFATVVVARGATTGRLTMFGHDMAMNQTCYALRSTIGAPLALYCHARHFIDRMVHAAHGSVFDTITTSTFETTDVLLAPEGILRAFDATVSPLLQRLRANLHESRTLAVLRDTLLPKLISGELRVPDAERIIKRAIDAGVLPPSPAVDTSATVYPVASLAENQPQPSRETPNDDDGDESESRPTIENYSREDVLAAVRELYREDPRPCEREQLLVLLRDRLGFGALGSKIRGYLEGDLLAAVRRGVLERRDNEYYVCCRAIEDYNRDFLKALFLQAIGRSWLDREEAMQQAARYLGFQRTGSNIKTTLRSVINGLIREGRVETDGSVIRRA
jgi:type I restriction enzyme, S subunit